MKIKIIEVAVNRAFYECIWHAEVATGGRVATLRRTGSTFASWHFLPDEEEASWWLRLRLWWAWRPYAAKIKERDRINAETRRQEKNSARWKALPEPEKPAELPTARLLED